MRPDPEQIAQTLRALDVAPDEAEVEGLWRGASARRGRPMRRVVLAAAAVILVALVLGRFATTPERTALRMADGSLTSVVHGRVESQTSFRFDDGSTIEVASNTVLDVVASRPDAIELALDDGRARFDIVPGGGRSWTIRCGAAEIAVLGTAFTLTRDGAALRVEVERGRVAVRSEAREELGAGDVLVVEHAYPEAPVEAPTVEAPAEPMIAPVEVAPLAVSPPPTARAQRPPPPTPSGPTWRELAGDHAWAEAYASLGSDGVRALAADATVDDLLSLADVCRSSRHLDDAAFVLDRLVSEHADDPAAPLAAYTLGALEMDGLHHPERAVRAFDRALELGLPSGMIADARARRARAASASAE